MRLSLGTPELDGFDRIERRILISRARLVMGRRSRVLVYLPEVLAVVGAVLGWLLGGFLFPFSPFAENRGDQLARTLAATLIGVTVGGIGFGSLGYSVLLRRLGPYIRNEIEAVVQKISVPSGDA